MTTRGEPWTAAEVRWLLEHQDASYDEYLAAGWDRTNRAWASMRLALRRKGELTEMARTSVGKRPLRIDMPDKRRPGLNWREVNRLIAVQQGFMDDSRGEQHRARIVVETDRPFPVIALSDLHIGAASVWYDGLERLTDQIMEVPDLRVFLLGDVVNAAIRMRGLAEVREDILSLGEQIDYVRSWLDEIDGRVLAAVWGNHDTQREEELTGSSSLGRLLSEKAIYSPGICEIDLRVGEAEYRVALTHKLGGGRSTPVNGAMKYIRENPSVHVAMAGDSHVPGVMEWSFDGTKRVALNTGSLNLKSGYARRHFSLRTEPVFPVVVFNPRRVAPTAFWTLDDWRESLEGAA